TVGALLEAGLVEQLVGEREVEAVGLYGRVGPGARGRRDDRARGPRVAEEDDADDLLAVDRVRHRGIDLEVQELAVAALLRDRVDDEVGLIDTGGRANVE